MWDSVIWEEIVEIGEEDVYEVEYITATAGVRGAEAEDEALAQLYYRKSMRGPSRMELREAYGKLKNKKDYLLKNDPTNSTLDTIDGYLLHISQKIERL